MHNVHGGTSWLKSEPGPLHLGSVCTTRISSPTYTFKQVSNLRAAFQAALSGSGNSINLWFRLRCYAGRLAIGPARFLATAPDSVSACALAARPTLTAFGLLHPNRNRGGQMTRLIT